SSHWRGPGRCLTVRLSPEACGLLESGPAPKACPTHRVLGHAVVPTIGFALAPSVPAPRKCYRCRRSLAVIGSLAVAAIGRGPVARARPPAHRLLLHRRPARTRSPRVLPISQPTPAHAPTSASWHIPSALRCRFGCVRFCC